MREPIYEDHDGPYLLRDACRGCGCWTIPVALHLLDVGDGEKALAGLHPCPVCGHLLQRYQDATDPDWWALWHRARETADVPRLDDAPLRRPWPDELPGLEDERLRHGSYGDWQDRVRRVRAPVIRFLRSRSGDYVYMNGFLAALKSEYARLEASGLPVVFGESPTDRNKLSAWIHFVGTIPGAVIAWDSGEVDLEARLVDDDEQVSEHHEVQSATEVVRLVRYVEGLVKATDQ